MYENLEVVWPLRLYIKLYINKHAGKSGLWSPDLNAWTMDAWTPLKKEKKKKNFLPSNVHFLIMIYDLHSQNKGFRFKFERQICAEVSSLQ